MSSLLPTWLLFLACALAIAAGGVLLTRYGDAIGRHTGASGSWIGMGLIATVTSLPELVTGVSATVFAGEPDIALGDVYGSCVFNLAILAVADLAYRRAPVVQGASRTHLVALGFGSAMLGLAGIGMLFPATLPVGGLVHIGVVTPVLVLLYPAALRSVRLYEAAHGDGEGRAGAPDATGPTLRQAVLGYAAAALVVVLAGSALPFVAVRLATAMQWQASFVGSLFVAVATSLPEVAATAGALRIGAVNLAMANLLGSNLFNMLILAVDDVLYLPGPILRHGSAVHLVSIGAALAMTGIVAGAVLRRPRRTGPGRVRWAGLALLAVYLVHSGWLYRAS